jgi:hypothetical protein
LGTPLGRYPYGADTGAGGATGASTTGVAVFCPTGNATKSSSLSSPTIDPETPGITAVFSVRVGVGAGLRSSRGVRLDCRVRAGVRTGARIPDGTAIPVCVRVYVCVYGVFLHVFVCVCVWACWCLKVRDYSPSSAAYSLPGGLVLHGHACCFGLQPGPFSSWEIGAGCFVDSAGTELRDFAAAAAYHDRTGQDV